MSFSLLPLPLPLSLSPPPAEPLAQRLFASLAAARSYDQARAAIAEARALSSPSPHAFRAALAELARTADTLRELTWPAVEALREAFEFVDTTLDTALIAAIARDPIRALAQE